MDLIDEMLSLGPSGFQVLLAKLSERNVVDPGEIPPDTVDLNTRVAGLCLLIKGKHQKWMMDALYTCLQEVQSITGLVPKVRIGINSLVELLKVGPIGQSIRSSSGEVVALKLQISQIARLKNLHENLQRLENTFGPLQRAIRASINGLQRQEVPDWETLRYHAREVRRIYDSLEFSSQGVQMKANFKDSLSKLAKATTDLESMIATETLDDRATKALARIKQIVDSEPSQINGSLFDGSKQLRLRFLVGIMEQVLHRAEELHVNGAATEHLRSLGEGIRNLKDLHLTIELHVDSHDLLQSVDDDLRLMASYLTREKAGDPLRIQDFQFQWEELQPRLGRIAAPLEEDTLQQLRLMSSKIQAATDCLDESRMRNSFGEFRDLFVQCFNRVDRSLLELCNRLMLIDDPLARVIAELQAA